MKTVLIVEDDGLQAQELESYLAGAYPGVSARCVSTELAFRRMVEKESPLPFALAIVDMMLRWTNPSPDMEMPPDELLREGFFVAGLRCCRALRALKIPCVIFTALDPGKVPLLGNEQTDLPIINKSRGFEALRPYLTQLSE